MNMGANLRRLRLEHRYTQDPLVAGLHLLEVPVTRAVCSGTKPGSGISRSAHSSRCISSIAAAVTPPHKTPGEALKRFPGGFGVISLVLPGLCPLSASLPAKNKPESPASENAAAGSTALDTGLPVSTPPISEEGTEPGREGSSGLLPSPDGSLLSPPDGPDGPLSSGGGSTTAVYVIPSSSKKIQVATPGLSG